MGKTPSGIQTVTSKPNCRTKEYRNHTEELRKQVTKVTFEDSILILYRKTNRVVNKFLSQGYGLSILKPFYVYSRTEK